MFVGGLKLVSDSLGGSRDRTIGNINVALDGNDVIVLEADGVKTLGEMIKATIASMAQDVAGHIFDDGIHDQAGFVKVPSKGARVRIVINAHIEAAERSGK